MLSVNTSLYKVKRHRTLLDHLSVIGYPGFLLTFLTLFQNNNFVYDIIYVRKPKMKGNK